MANLTLEQRMEKRAQAQGIMNDLGIPMWITWVADNAAENATLPLIGAPEGACTRAYVLTPEKAVSFCFHTEAGKQPAAGFDLVETDRDVMTPLVEGLGKHFDMDSIRVIALNVSEKFDSLDTLGHGTYRKLTQALARKYADQTRGIGFCSAEELIITAASTKLPFEVEYLRKAAETTDRVLVDTFAKIKVGMTEKDIAAIAKGITAEIMRADSSVNYGWPASLNPIVLVGEGIAGSPHAAPTDRVLNAGETVYIDFGLSFNGYGGDLQHMGYALKPGETSAPADVQARYDLLVRSIQAGMRAAVPGVKGWEVDKASRDIILEAGYPSYKHGTGHQLGCGNDHAPGVAFTQLHTPEGAHVALADLAVREGYVMTIEPRLQVANGASIEVDGIITKEGFKPLVPMQERIHLI